MEYKVVNYDEAMFPWLLAFYKEMVGGVFRSRDKGQHFLSNILRKPNFNPRKDLFVAQMGETIAGILFLIAELKIGRIVLSCQVHHNFPYQSVATALWNKGIHRCKEIDGENIHVSVHENFKAARDFFAAADFSSVRKFLELECSLAAIPNVPKAQMSRLTYLKEGEESLLAELQNRIFNGSWGFCPNTEEDIQYYLALTQCRLNDVLLLKEEENLIGYFWAHAGQAGDLSLKIGRIHMFGIAPEFQGRGLGKKLLRIGLEDMKAKGFEAVELTVDEDNFPAVALYGSFDFHEKYTSIWYEKTLKDID